MADKEELTAEEREEHTLEELREKNRNRIEKFKRKALQRGTGYRCPNFPLFDKYMEGLESGLFMIAGESNSGKSALAMSLSWDYMANPDNNLYLVYFSLDDSADDIFPRIVAMNKDIPISVTSKPTIYLNKRDEGDSSAIVYDEYLHKSEEGLNELEDLGEKFTLLDGSDITCGEEILEACKDIRALVRTRDRNANIIVVIDSLMDIAWRDKTFKSDKELNDYTAKQIKKWAVEILDCPIFGTLHLRKIDQNRRPTIADVKESGRYAYEASFLGLVHNDVSRNKQAATICLRDEDDNITPVIELNWAKNKKSSYKGMTYQTFVTNHSLVRECPEETCERFAHLIYQN